MNSELVEYTHLSPNHSGRRTRAIDRITPHCVVGQLDAVTLGDWFSRPSTQASCNYAIDRDGRVALIVDEGNRSWCSASNANDQRAVTIECASGKENPYAFTDIVYQTLVNLCVDICQRHGKTKLLWISDKAKALAYEPGPGEMLLTVHRWFSSTECIPANSEVLTRNGWVRLRDIQIGDEIACADLENLRVSFEEVYDKVPERDQDTYTNNGFTATKDHRCVYGTQSNKNYRIDYYRHLLSSGTQIYLPMAGYADFDGLSLTDDELRFLIAVQADGHYMHESWGGSDHYTGLEFHLKKQRKIDRILEILDACHYDYTQSSKADGSRSIRIWGSEVIDECEKYLNDKCFTWDWINMSREQANLFLSEILLWDGCEVADKYSSTKKENLDIVSAIAALNGKGSTTTGSEVRFFDTPFSVLGKNPESTKRNNKQHKTAKTRVSCVSVKTGIFLVRQNGKTFITGNCPGGWMMAHMADLAERVSAHLDRLRSGEDAATEAPGGSVTLGASLADLMPSEAVKILWDLAKEDEKRSGILASITCAQAILESGYCKSELAVKANNLFGMKTILSGNTWPGSTWDGVSTYTKETLEYDESGTPGIEKAAFRQYRSLEESIADHSAYLLGARSVSWLRYPGIKGEDDFWTVAVLLYRGRYATDPKYPDKLLSIAKEWGLLDLGKAIAPAKKPETQAPYLVRVSITDLRIRSGPSTQYGIQGYIPVGVYTIVETRGNWGRLKSGAGWICLDYAERV